MKVRAVLALLAWSFVASNAGAQAPAAQQPGAEQPAANPHRQQVARDSSEDAPDLPPGTIEVLLGDPDDRPLGNTDVRLAIVSQKISEGESRSQKNAKTDAEGRARFAGLSISTDMSYRVTVQAGGAEFASTPFNLRDQAGHRVILHVYPTTSDMTRTVALGVFLSVEPRDDLFQLEMVFHVFNVSRMAWLPNDVVVELPEGFKAFGADEGMFDSRFEPVEGRGAKLLGTFPPGERRVRFRFQIPKETQSEVTFRVGLPPRVAQAQVLAAASPQMTLEVQGGFPPAQADRSSQGDRVLHTMRTIQQGENPIRSLGVTLTGLRVPGIGRWVAVLLALGFASVGGLAARGNLRIASTERVQGDRVRARDLILQELVLVERARASEEIGPNAYDRARRSLLDALARIGVPDEKKHAKKRKVRAATS